MVNKDKELKLTKKKSDFLFWRGKKAEITIFSGSFYIFWPTKLVAVKVHILQTGLCSLSLCSVLYKGEMKLLSYVCHYVFWSMTTFKELTHPV